jgi:hypothetical protein
VAVEENLSCISYFAAIFAEAIFARIAPKSTLNKL